MSDLMDGGRAWSMMNCLKLRTRLSLVMATVAVVLQLVTFVIPGWLIIETATYSFDMALWYAIFCDRRANLTSRERCETVTYSKMFNTKSSALISQLDLETPFMVSIQWQVTLSFVLSIASFVIILYQLNTFQTRTPDQSRRYGDSGHSSKLRARFIYCAGFTGLFQIIAGPMLGVVVYGMLNRYYNLENSMAIPYTLFLVGIAAVCESFSAINQLLMAFRTRVNDQGEGRHHKHHQDERHHADDPAQSHLHSPGPATAVDFNDSEHNGDYYGQDYNPQNPRYHTQGNHKHNSSANFLFPGYRLGRHNLQGHDKKWWRSVTLASGVR